MTPLHDAALHAAHAMPFEALKGASDVMGEDVLRVRYDGHVSDGAPRVYAVIPVRDLSRVSDAIRFPEPPGIGFPGSDIFFLRTPDGTSAYIDTDSRETLWMSILDTAMDRGIQVVEAQGDLMRLCHAPRVFGKTGADVRAPRDAAYEVHRFEHVPIEIGIEEVTKNTARPTPNDPGLLEP